MTTYQSYLDWLKLKEEKEATSKTHSIMTDSEAMQLAYFEALRGIGTVAENPLVGAVALDKNNVFIAAESHRVFAQEHAELRLINKIKKLGREKDLKGAKIYVTLEPCAHQGKTGSCAKLLTHYPIAELIYGEKDPFIKVNGRGLQILENAGIKTRPLCWNREKQDFLSERFKKSILTKQVFIAMKVASSIDGMICLKKGEQKWITGEASKQYGHWLRLLYDAILIGSETCLIDKPQLTVRALKENLRTPLRVVLDVKGKVLAQHCFQELELVKNETERTLWCINKEILLDKNLVAKLKQNSVPFLPLNSFKKDIIIAEILQELRKRKLSSLLLEGGAELWASFFNIQKIDQLHLFQAPIIYGSAEGIHWNKAFFTREQNLEAAKAYPLGRDFLIEAKIK